MAIVRAVKSGNWSDTTVWNTGALPTSADDVYSNTFTVTIDVSPTVLSISNAAATGVTAGGRFEPTNGITLTCTAVNGASGGSVAVLLVSFLGLGSSCTVILSYSGAGFIVQNSGLGTVNVIGNFVAGGANNQKLIDNSTGGVINITGNCTGGAVASAAHCAYNSAAGTLNITGNVTGGSSGAGAANQSTGTLNVTGTVTGGTRISDSTGVLTTAAGVISVVGSIVASSGAPGLSSSSASAQIVLTGPFITSANGVNPVYAASWRWASTNPATYYQIRTVNTNVLRPLYTADSVGGNPATSNVRSGTVYGPNNELTGTCAVPPAGSVALGVPVDNTTGTAAITAANIRSAVGLASANLDTQLAAIPTAAAPSASSIAAAVWSAVTRTITGGTVDTLTNAPSVPSAAAIASAVWAAADKTGYSLTNAERQAIATAVEQSILNEGDGQQVLNAIVGAINNSNVDQIALVAAIRSDLERTGGTLATRLAASAYTAPLDAAGTRSAVGLSTGNLDAQLSSISSGISGLPSAATIAAAVWAAATRTLTTAFDNSATIAAAVWSAATRTLTSNAAPSAADNAAAVWGYSSGRTVTGGTVDTLTNAPDVPTEGEIADAVRTKLTPELTRMANAATTQEVGDIVEGALAD